MMRVLLIRELAVLYFLNVAANGTQGIVAKVAELFQEARLEAGIQPQHVRANQNLTAAASTGTDTDRRNAERFRDAAGNVFGHKFEHDGEGSGIFSGAGIVEQSLFIALDLAHAAELTNCLGSHADMSHHRNLSSTNSSNRFGLDRSTFQFNRIGAGFFHDASRILHRLLRTHVIRHERHVHNHKRSLHSASNQFAVINHLIESHGERR